MNGPARVDIVIDNDVSQRVAAQMPRALTDLADLVKIPSIGALADHASDVDRSAEAVAALVRDLGWDDVKIVRAGGKPAVIAHYPAPEGAPTICLYSHHDVQPTGDPAQWESDPHTLTERDGRLYGRGAVDDKGGIVAHLAALRAFDGRPPVGVTLFFEGEEESGSPTMGALLDEYGHELDADAFVLLDSGNWQVGLPAFTASLRGLADVVVEVRTLDHPLHSGQFGGVVPDALTSLCVLLATLWDADGSVAVEGLATAPVADLDYPEDRFRTDSGVLDGVEFIGRGSIVERNWGQPSVTVIGLDAPSVEKSSNTLVASARAKVSLRLAPNQDAQAALAALKKHLLDHAPFGAHVVLGDGEAAGGTQIDLDGPIATTLRGALAQAYGTDVVDMGMGGSIPLTAMLRAKFPEAEVLLTGIADPDCRMHGFNESVALADLQAAATAEALLFAELGSRTTDA